MSNRAPGATLAGVSVSIVGTIWRVNELLFPPSGSDSATGAVTTCPGTVTTTRRGFTSRGRTSHVLSAKPVNITETFSSNPEPFSLIF
ncbi:MAG: hypothetical protein IPF82_03570 [Blastocatellia bacterium]|nr:hypothetical protein [Blastocatellia bacterium]